MGTSEVPRVVAERPPEISRKKPGCLVFLVDQSGSMSEPFIGTTYTKADAVAVTINETIYRLLANSAPQGEVWDYYHVGALGYGGGKVRIAFGGKLEGMALVKASELDASPRRIATKQIDQDGEMLTVKQPEWIVPRAGGMTPMVAAIEQAARVVEEWCRDFPESIPPIVMNLSDGESSDGHPRKAAKALTAIGTRKGPTRFFNLQLTSAEVPAVQFPHSAEAVKNQFARVLFDVSSELPPYMIAMARGLGLAVEDQARGFCCNADMATLVDFLDVGSTPGNMR